LKKADSGSATGLAERQDAAILQVLEGLTHAWNSGDGLEFASYFAEDGDLVNIHGMRLRGRLAIAGVYDLLFRSVFHQSRLEVEVSGCRPLCDTAVLLHMSVVIEIPSGMMPGVHCAVCSVLLHRDGGRWCIASLHNTLVADGQDRRGMVSAA
jgi:uncharacterized protein (TIGR02246 family)